MLAVIDPSWFDDRWKNKAFPVMHAFLTHNQKPWFVHMTLGYEIYDVTSFLTRFFNLFVFQSKKGNQPKKRNSKKIGGSDNIHTTRHSADSKVQSIIDHIESTLLRY